MGTPSCTFDTYPVRILDGGMGSELEARGFNLNHSLWASRVLVDDPAAIRDIHLDYYNAGAHIITTNTYQASLEGCVRHLGITASQAEELFHTAVELANEARILANRSDSGLINESFPRGVLRSCGPYGATLHDGSEYTGTYPEGTTDDVIAKLHRDRLRVLATNLDGFETIPNVREAHIIMKVLREFPSLRGRIWISFSTTKTGLLYDGTTFSDAVSSLLSHDSANRFIVGIGINCVLPRTAVKAIQSLQASLKDRLLRDDVELICYPNSGETWDPVKQDYGGIREGLLSCMGPLLDSGVRVIGGCCRVGPSDISSCASKVRAWLATAQIARPALETEHMMPCRVNKKVHPAPPVAEFCGPGTTWQPWPDLEKQDNELAEKLLQFLKRNSDTPAPTIPHGLVEFVLETASCSLFDQHAVTVAGTAAHLFVSNIAKSLHDAVQKDAETQKEGARVSTASGILETRRVFDIIRAQEQAAGLAASSERGPS